MKLKQSLAATSLLMACHAQSPQQSSAPVHTHIGRGEVARVRESLYGCMTHGAIPESQVHRLRIGEVRDGVSCDQGQPYQHAERLLTWQFHQQDNSYLLCVPERLQTAPNIQVVLPGTRQDGFVCTSCLQPLTDFTESRLLLAADIHGIHYEPFDTTTIVPPMDMEEALCLNALPPSIVNNVHDGHATFCTPSGPLDFAMSRPYEHLPWASAEMSCRPGCHDQPHEEVVILPINRGFGCNISDQGARIFVCDPTNQTNITSINAPIQPIHPGDRVTCQGITFVCTR